MQPSKTACCAINQLGGRLAIPFPQTPARAEIDGLVDTATQGRGHLLLIKHGRLLVA